MIKFLVLLLFVPLWYVGYCTKRLWIAWNECYLKSHRRMVALQQCHYDCILLVAQQEKDGQIISLIGKECAKAVRPWSEE